MVPIPEGTESYPTSPESIEYGESQEDLDQPMAL
jgi:hypothetical protein